MILPRARLAAYRRAFYRADAGAGRVLEIRVGRRAPSLDDILAENGKRRWAFLTACNPGARRLSARENRGRTNELRLSLRRSGFLFFAGRGGSDAGDWTEEASFLVIGIARRDADRLRRRFGQDAIVTGLRGGVARLWPR
jgi:hypothetical protein